MQPTLVDGDATKKQSLATQQRDRLDEKLRRELGPLVLNALNDALTEDVCLNPDGNLWVKRLGYPFKTTGKMSATQAESAIGTIAAQHSTVVNYKQPIIECELPIDGSRFEGLISPVVRNPIFAIRLRPKRVFRLAEYEQGKILTDKNDPMNRLKRSRNFLEEIRGLSHTAIIRRSIEFKKNILVVGSTGSGKTTFVNAVLAEMTDLAPHDRIISIEDTIELQCPVDNYVDLRAVGAVTMLDCLRACMRLKPSRIVVGEVRGLEAHTLLKSWNTGHPGGCATVHANDAISGLIRLESLLAEATAAPQQSLIAEAVDVVVFIDEEGDLPAGRKVREVLAVTGWKGGEYQVEHL